MNKLADIPGSAPMMKVPSGDRRSRGECESERTDRHQGGAPIMAPTPIGNASHHHAGSDGYFIEAIQAAATDIAATTTTGRRTRRQPDYNHSASEFHRWRYPRERLSATWTRRWDTGTACRHGMPKAGEFSNDAAMLNLMGLPSGASIASRAGHFRKQRESSSSNSKACRENRSPRPTDASLRMALRSATSAISCEVKASGSRVFRRPGARRWNATTRNVFVKIKRIESELVGSADPNLRVGARNGRHLDRVL
jgi:hypothetical protein